MSIKLTSISPSRIKTFDMCLFKYFLTYNCPDIKLKSNFGATNGSLIHNVLEQYSTGNDKDWANRLMRGYGGLLDDLESPLVWAKEKDYADKEPHCDSCPHALLEIAAQHGCGDLKDGICGISRERLDNLPGCPLDLFNASCSMTEITIKRYQESWKKILKNKDNIPIGTEYNFNVLIKNTDVPMNGIMDLVLEEKSDTVHIIDYKTGSWTQDYNECRQDWQVRMYSLAARREFIDDINNKGYKYKNVILTFDYFTKDPITLAFTEKEDNKTELDVYNKIQQIQNTEWINRIVNSNDDLKEKRFWQCRALCDTAICSQQWKGKFKV